MKYIKLIFLFVLLSLIAIGCTSCATTTPVRNRTDICAVFREKPQWYWSAQDVRKKWGLPMSVLMAIMYQESRFGQHARPPRRKLLWVIPWMRPTSAYGYSQAIKDTWLNYKYTTGNARANRKDFEDAADFIGWYANQISQKLGIPKTDAYRLYLAYHEGTVGYARGTYKRKPWLIDVARNVQRRAWIYQTQLMRCKSSLPKKHWWNF